MLVAADKLRYIVAVGSFMFRFYDKRESPDEVILCGDVLNDLDRVDQTFKRHRSARWLLNVGILQESWLPCDEEDILYMRNLWVTEYGITSTSLDALSSLFISGLSGATSSSFLLQGNNGLWYATTLALVDGQPILQTPVLVKDVPSGQPPTRVFACAADETSHRVSIVIDDAGNPTLAVDQAISTDQPAPLSLVTLDSRVWPLGIVLDAGTYSLAPLLVISALVLKGPDGRWYSSSLALVNGKPVLQTPVIADIVTGSSAPSQFFTCSEDGTNHRLQIVIDDAGNPTLTVEQSPAPGPVTVTQLSLTTPDDQEWPMAVFRDSGTYFFAPIGG